MSNLSLFRSPLFIIIFIALSILLCEIMVMLLISFMPFFSPRLISLIDIISHGVILVPAFYFFLFRPLLYHIKERNSAVLELQKSEEKLAWIMNSLTDFIFVVDDRMIIIWANRAAFDLLGKNLVGKSLETAFEFKRWPSFHEKVRICFVSRKKSEFELKIEENNKASMFLLGISFVAAWNKDGSPASAIIVLRDITETTKLKEESFRAHQLASIGELAAGVAHEINNPINGIINCAQMLLDEDGLKNDRIEILHRIITAGHRVAAIVGNLLSFARKREEELDWTSVKELVSEVLKLVGTQLLKENIDVKIIIPDDIPKIRARENQIQQVFLNLISNARYALNKKYQNTSEKKVLEIKGELVKRNDNLCVKITFSDNGNGIPADIGNRVFDPFFTSKSIGEGTGLGLSISRSIINNHGGKLYFETVEGEFTEMIIELPV